MAAASNTGTEDTWAFTFIFNDKDLTGGVRRRILLLPVISNKMNQSNVVCITVSVRQLMVFQRIAPVLSINT